MLENKIWRKENGILAIEKNGKIIEVSVKESFPWSHPGEFLSLRDCDDNEVELIESLETDVNESVKTLLKHELISSQFVLKIKSILDIEEDVELRKFSVVTEQGERQFQTKLEDWPEVLEGNVILMEDLAGDIYQIHDYSKLDAKSRKKLSPYVS